MEIEEVGELQLNILNSDKDKEIAFREIQQKLNEVITRLNEVIAAVNATL